jgi:hypothetical protein
VFRVADHKFVRYSKVFRLTVKQFQEKNSFCYVSCLQWRLPRERPSVCHSTAAADAWEAVRGKPLPSFTYVTPQFHTPSVRVAFLFLFSFPILSLRTQVYKTVQLYPTKPTTFLYLVFLLLLFKFFYFFPHTILLEKQRVHWFTLVISSEGVFLTSHCSYTWKVLWLLVFCLFVCFVD